VRALFSFLTRERIHDQTGPRCSRSKSDERAALVDAVMFTLIQTAKLNNVDPQAWLADVLARIADHKIADLAALLPWNWAVEMERRKLAA
jgi:hypothetical protein